MDAHLLQQIALFMPALLLSLSVHEYAHAWSATKLGDPTPSRQGRLTLSPLAHMDLFGTLIFPLVLLILGHGVFGWAKPVEFNATNFTRKVTLRQGQALTAIAGPLSNVVLALISAVILRILAAVGALEGSEIGRMTLHFLQGMFFLNVLLAVFNLMPLPPLDGHWLLPRSLDHVRDWLRRYSIIIFVAVFFIPLPGIGRIGFLIMDPIMNALGSVLRAIAFIGT